MHLRLTFEAMTDSFQCVCLSTGLDPSLNSSHLVLNRFGKHLGTLEVNPFQTGSLDYNEGHNENIDCVLFNSADDLW